MCYAICNCMKIFKTTLKNEYASSSLQYPIKKQHILLYCIYSGIQGRVEQYPMVTYSGFAKSMPDSTTVLASDNESALALRYYGKTKELRSYSG